jgi:hypothetical protein
MKATRKADIATPLLLVLVAAPLLATREHFIAANRGRLSASAQAQAAADARNVVMAGVV